MATYYVRDVDGVSWWLNPSLITGFRIHGTRNGQILSSVTLWCDKFTNYGWPIYWYSGGSVPAGSVTSNGTITVRLKVNNNLSNETYTITNKVAMGGAGNYFDECWANCVTTYTFTFNDVPINSDTLIYVIASGLDMSNGLSIRAPGYVTIDGLTRSYQGTAEVFDEPQGPQSISTSSVSGDNGWITDLTGPSRNSSQGILKDSTCKYNLIPNPSNAKITEVKFSGMVNTNCSYNSSNKVITVKATNKNTDYPKADNITVEVNGGAKTSFTTRFYEKPKANLSGNNSIELNIRTAGDKGFTLSGYNPSTINNTADRALFLDNSYLSTFTPQNSNTLLNVGQYLKITSNSSNLFKINKEGTRHTLKWRFFNHNVQTRTSEKGTYKKDITTYVTWYITPNMINQFSFDWLDINGNILSDDPPDIIIPEFDAPLIGNLKYSNAAVAGGYCRGFRIQYIDNSNTVVYTDYINATINNSTGVASTSGRILNTAKLNNLPYDKELTIKITMYFYFNDSTTTRYYGSTYTLKQKLIRIREEDLYPTLIFPIVNQQSPYTPMMLEDVERFGYELSDIVVNNQELFDTDFGLLVDGKEVNFNTAQEYISSIGITKHLVYDIGKYVKDNKLYLSELTVLPYIDVYYGKTYIKRITVKGGNDKTPNAVIVTTLDSMWNRPVAQSGEYTTYFDYDRFMQFINKYRALYNNQLFNVPTDKRGDIINTDFWLDIANKLDIYATNMQNWATNTTNFIVLWALPEFKHEKGEYITNNNLYQNYYDLLIQHSGYDSFATHDYLNENNYTHNELGTHTHDEITNKDGI